MNQKYFTLIRNDVLNNKHLSLGAKGLYALISYDLTTSLRNLLIDSTTKRETIQYVKEQEKFDYVHFYNLDNCENKDSPIGMHVLIQPSDEFKKSINNKCKEQAR
ncbi:MAG: hypothetical protein R3Y21_04380 [Mycoplasmatota bacterium]